MRAASAETGISSWSVAPPAIGRVTFTEILRDKILYNVLVCGFFLFGLGYLASRLTFIRPERVVLDFGQSAIRISCSMIAIFIGAGLIGREFERRTIHVALSRPISRAQFVVGKFLGISGVIAANWVLLGLSYFGILFFMYGGFGFLNATLFEALFLNLLQALVVASIALFLSTFSTTSLSVIMSIGLYLVGSNVSELRAVIDKIQAPAVQNILTGVTHLIPNFQYFDLGSQLTYAIPISVLTLLGSITYAIVVGTIFVSLAGFLVRLREV